MTDLARRNMRLIAAREGWPAGAIDACEQMEDSHCGLVVTWFPKNSTKGFERAEGFYAWHADDAPGHMTFPESHPHGLWRRRYEWYAATPQEQSMVLLPANVASGCQRRR